MMGCNRGHKMTPENTTDRGKCRKCRNFVYHRWITQQDRASAVLHLFKHFKLRELKTLRNMQGILSKWV